jgi:ribosomal protein S30
MLQTNTEAGKCSKKTPSFEKKEKKALLWG